MGYDISNTWETTGTLTLPRDDWLLDSTTAEVTFSKLEDWICFLPLPRRMPSCRVVSNFFIILRRAQGDIGTLRICFIRRNFFTAATGFCWFQQNNFISSVCSCNVRRVCREVTKDPSFSAFFYPKKNTNKHAL